MTVNDTDTCLCPVAVTLSLIGGRHKALILWNLLDGTMRYSELRRAVPAATPKMLTQQLRELEADGLVVRKVYPVVPPRVDYSLTPTGESIRPILTSMYRWGKDYLASRNLEVNCSMKPPAEDEAQAGGQDDEADVSAPTRKCCCGG